MPRGHQLPQAQNGANATSKAAGHESAESRDAPVISPAAVADMVFNEPRLLVCTTFVGDPGPDMTGFNQWLANTPSLASKVAVEGMFLGPPTVLLISIPQSLWTVIQDAKICFSLGYINSHNLINLYNGLMKSTTVPHSHPTALARDIEDGRTLLEAREAAVNTSPTYRNDFHTYQQQPAAPQTQQQPAAPQTQQQPAAPQTQQQQSQKMPGALPPLLQQHHQPQHQQSPLNAWDEWTEHVGRHMENGEGEFLGVDDLLISWALDEGIISRTEDNTYRLCNPMGSGTGGGSNGNGGSMSNSSVISNANANSNSSNNGNGSGNNWSTATTVNTVDTSSNDTMSRNGNVDLGTNDDNALPPSTNAEGAKDNASPQISVVNPVTDTNGLPPQRTDKLTMPPTPPQLTTRLQPGSAEKSVKETEKPARSPTKKVVSTANENESSPNTVSTVDNAAIAAVDTLTAAAAAAISSLSEDKQVGNIRPPSGADSGEKPVAASKIEDLSGLQSITVAAIAAAAALQQHENEENTNGAMDVDG
ncbi:hypothetical protein HMPREF1624_06705 [Sporothrix schenckii ATCC 58251]|uniref:Uncharacterized protein n=1 Tax=Sporothrix schenckii (strain ATCC 58251 / de Perez 2211183) TaxID=1391915 RepID=U7PP29_SPOS1|nr:hypothetical protein HMPREF1624_06705 [Sporothrix schenckii ATCC 58251]